MVRWLEEDGEQGELIAYELTQVRRRIFGHSDFGRLSKF